MLSLEVVNIIWPPHCLRLTISACFLFWFVIVSSSSSVLNDVSIKRSCTGPPPVKKVQTTSFISKTEPCSKEITENFKVQFSFLFFPEFNSTAIYAILSNSGWKDLSTCYPSGLIYIHIPVVQLRKPVCGKLIHLSAPELVLLSVWSDNHIPIPSSIVF